MACTPLPKIRPTPMPGPIAARPYPTEPMLPVRPSVAARTALIPFSPSIGRRVVHRSGLFDEQLVRFFNRLADVAGDKHREDVRLQELDQQLEGGHDDG